MKENILSIGDKIELYHGSSQFKREKKLYISQLLDLLDDNKANLAMPIDGGRIIPMDIGETYSLLFYTKYGLYHCECIVVNRYKTQNLYIVVVEFTTDLEKNQRRQFFRWECLIDFVYRVMADNIPETWKKGIITDISGGGLRFTAESKEENNDKLLLSFSLFTAGGLKTFQQLGIIIAVNPIVKKKSMYEYRVEFCDISEEDRETIVRYIFDEERKQRRKEKGLK